ncbi:Transcriptional regulator [Savitreella phatthalungensis]
MPISPPILSEEISDLSLPSVLNKLVTQLAVPSSADLTSLNASLSTLVASTEARARALRRDLELLAETYGSLRRRVDVKVEEHQQEEDAQAGTGSPFSDVALDEGDSPEPEPVKKRRLGVASYPASDLAEFLPGKPSTDDYTKVKIPNQIAITTFYTSVEPYFRTLTEEDIGWLRDPGDQLTPFIIPPLGTHYLELWQDSLDSPPPRQDSGQAPREDAAALNDENVQQDMVSAGPLTTRLLSALMKEDDLQADEDADGESSVQDAVKGSRVPAVKLNYGELEERVQGELTHIGLLEGNGLDWSQTADDEISAELRQLQDDLKYQIARNNSMKRKLLSLAQDEMAKDEYQTILDDLDKQVEQAFLKSNRNLKGKRKGVALTKTSSAALRSLVEKRQKWINAIGPIVDHGRKRIARGIFEDAPSKSAS